MEHILPPSKITFSAGETPSQGILTVEPCFYGYGTTIGNALRRVMLSSLVGAAVTAVKIKGVSHEFQPVPGVKEDALEIVLNLKGLRMKVHTDEPIKMYVRARGEKIVTAADIEANADVEIMNPELVLATLTESKAEFEMELLIRRGRGFVPTEQRVKEAKEIGMIAIDSLFSPVRHVGYRVENTRVGDITNYDKLIMTIETDGTISPEDAVRRSAQLLMDHFSLFLTTTVESSAAPSSAESGSEAVDGSTN